MVLLVLLVCLMQAVGKHVCLLRRWARSLELNTYKSKHSFCRAKARERKGMICACCSTVGYCSFR
jgi:hypothetical protein